MPARSSSSAVAATKPLDEKITINIGYVDLGQIDLLVQEGFYANRTDMIRTAIRNQIASHAEAVKQAVARKTLVLGIQHFSADDLRAVRKAKQMLQVRVLGEGVVCHQGTRSCFVHNLPFHTEVAGAERSRP